jgi:3-hydroxy-9,10-secoandrosta-1,3,5(10)-triene-9,17-dione monooxygenase
MTLVTSVSAPGFPPVPEPELTREAVLARARQIGPTLVARQAETEQRTYYARDTHEEFARAGFYRILVPRRYGGYELGVDTFMRVAIELTRGCPSTGWMYLFGAAHALAAATLFGEEAQDELFTGGDFVCPATVAPSGSARLTQGGDWLLSGVWTYCSGAPYATHFMGHTLVPQGGDEPPAPMLFIVPREQWLLQDDWGEQLGLKGSGSHSITMEDARIPARFTIMGHLSQLPVTSGTPGRTLHGPQYGGGPLSFMLLELGALAVGMAKGALDTYEELLRTRKTAFLPIVTRAEDPDYQHRYGEAAGMIATAEAALLNAVHQWAEICTRGSAAFTREEELRLATISREVVRLAWRAVESHLVASAGSGSMRAGERMERVWRDMSMLHSHAGVAVFLATMASRELTRVRFGLT